MIRMLIKFFCWVLLYVLLGGGIFLWWTGFYIPSQKAFAPLRSQYKTVQKDVNGLKKVTFRSKNQLFFKSELLNAKSFNLSLQKALKAAPDVTLIDLSEEKTPKTKASNYFGSSAAILGKVSTVRKVEYSFKVMGKFMPVLGLVKWFGRQGRGIFWNSFRLNMEDYPTAVVAMKFYILERAR
jgi:hypothetical protein